MEVIAEQSKKITDVAAISTSNVSGMFGNIFNKIMSMISVGIFKSPPFSLENIFPGVDFFKNKYFKLASILVIYLGSMGIVLKAFKPTTTESMIVVYSVCFWITLMAFSIAVVNPYDETTVEFMLKDKVITKMKEIVNEKPGPMKKPDTLTENLLEIKPSAPELPEELIKPSAPKLPEELIKPSAPNQSKVPPTSSVTEEKGFLANTIKSFF
jgi:hypothetical protein